MMLLGIILHSSNTYMVFDAGEAWVLKDPNSTHPINGILSGTIHSFRMQIFFLIAGFFGSMLFYERKPLTMIKNRISRIVLPFIVFVILLWPIIVFTFSYTELLFDGNKNAMGITLSYFNSPFILIPESTFHLWFLFYLSLITIVTVILGSIFKKLPRLSNYISTVFEWIMEKTYLRVFIFSFLTAILYLIIGSYESPISNSFTPDLDTFIYFLFFYLIGWVLFKSKHLLSTFLKADRVFAFLGLLIFTPIFLIISPSLDFEINIIITSLILWINIFGIMGLFIRYTSNHSNLMRYISDASYWVYLIHLPLTVIIPGLIVDWPIHAIIKMLFVSTCTSIICFVSYHYLVRNTFIGQFLNGRKYSGFRSIS